MTRIEWFFSLLMLFVVAWIGHSFQIYSVTKVQAETSSSKVVALSGENQALKERLDASAKIETPEAVQELAKQYIYKYFGKDAQKAIKITQCESHWNNLVVHKNTDGSVDRGIFQINSVHAQQFKQVTGLDYETGALDFNANVQFAKWLFDAQSWRPWVCQLLI